MPAATPLYRLVYASTARPGLSDRDISDILNVSANNNNQRFVTGFLVFNGSAFMQVLEGPVDEVMDIYSRIMADDRHTGVVQAGGEMATERAFPNWDMNYYRAELSDIAQKHEGMVAERLPDSVPEWLRELLIQFATIR
jgi:hypothetical protein